MAWAGAGLWVCCALIFAPAVISEENNTTANELACPQDSAWTPEGCSCQPCPPAVPPPTCAAPSAPELRPATGRPGACCELVRCVQPPERNCTGDACGSGGGDCPEDSYRAPGGGTGCQCLPLPQGCPRGKSCPPGARAKIVRPATGRPGRCCALYECVPQESNVTCVDWTTGTMEVRADGSAWFGAECARCRCADGLVLCDADAASAASDADDGLCPTLACPRTAVPAGQCCPVCLDDDGPVAPTATSGSSCAGPFGEFVLNGGRWQEDDCTSCVCEAGQRRCQAYMCEACAEPRYEPGECCPRCNGSAMVTVPSHCPSLQNCSLRCVHGFVRDADGCFTCHCQQDECLLDCPLGFEQDSHGNMLCRCAALEPESESEQPPALPSVPSAQECPPLDNCRKRCLHGFRSNKAGCPVCRCESCAPLDRCTKRCAHGLRTDARGCPVCSCAPFERTAGNTNETLGTPCVSDSKVWRDDGETWFDGCRQCYCMSGREMCSLLSCPPALCATPLYNSSKDCCPYCPGSELSSAASAGSHTVCQGSEGVLLEGETFSADGCVSCVCQGGRVLCHAASCPPAPCALPLPPPPGECCPVCPPDQLDNQTLSVGCTGRRGQAMWREGNCVSCACRAGDRPACFTELCPRQDACANPLRVKNQCCPICLDKVAGVTERRDCTASNGSLVPVGGDWRQDECTTCVCVAGGEIACTKLICSVNCVNPERRPGVCCLVCPESQSLGPNHVIAYVIVLSAVACAALCLGFCTSRLVKRLKRHRLKLHDGYGGPPPQYTQYRYMPTYDSAQQSLGTTEKTALTPL